MKNFKLYFPFAVLTNTFYQGLGRLIATSLGILTTILLTRYLGVLGFGQFNLILAYFAFAGTFADFGLGLLLTREIAGNSAKKEYQNALFTFRLFLSLFVLLVFVVLALFLPYPKQVLSGIIIYAFGNLFTLLYNMYFAVFQAKLHLEKHLISQSLGALMILFLTFLFIIQKLAFGWFIFAQVIGALTTFLAGWKLLELKLSLNINFPAFRKILKDGWPLSLTGIIAIFYSRADIFILSFFKNPGNLPDVGIYSLAYRIFEVVLIFSTFFSNALFPIFIKEIKNDNFKKILNQSLVLSLIGGLFVTFGVIIFARQIVLVVAGEKFVLATLPIQILSLAFTLSLFLNIYYNLVVTLNKQKFLILVGIIALGFNLLANVIFIPRFSYLASSVITVLTAAIILCGYILIYAFSRRSHEK